MHRTYIAGIAGALIIAALVGAWWVLGSEGSRQNAVGSNFGTEVQKKTMGQPPEGFAVYQDDERHFGLFYPSQLTHAVSNSGTARTVVFQLPEGGYGFQIFSIPYTEPKITEKQFKRDVPSGVRKNEVMTQVGGVEAVRFYSVAQIGDTVEVWFIRDGYLYEVTTYKEMESDLEAILATWVFI